MLIIYCNASNIGKLLVEINAGLSIDTIITLKIQEDHELYYGYFVYYGFRVINTIELEKKIIIQIAKQKTVNHIKDKKYSLFIKLPRTGQNGKRIFVYKLRTMQPYSEYIQDFVIEQNGLNQNGTIKNDFRITRLGNFLRKYWLDELPMLINFFKGELKLIGIRPLSDSMLKQYPKEFRTTRNQFKPGLIPPYYIDKPKSFENIIKSEEKYMQSYSKKKLHTDVKYFFLFLKAVFIGRVRSS